MTPKGVGQQHPNPNQRATALTCYCSVPPVPGHLQVPDLSQLLQNRWGGREGVMLEVEENWHHTYRDVSGYSWEHSSHSSARNSTDFPLPFLPSRALPDLGDKQPPPLLSCPQTMPQHPI